MTKYRIVGEWDYDLGEVRYWIQKKHWYGWDFCPTEYPSHGYFTFDQAEEILKRYLKGKDLKVIKEYVVE